MNKTIVKIGLTTIAGISVFGIWATRAYAASTTGNAVQVVTAAISIANVSNLDFGSAPQGDVAKTVAPAAVENATNGSFTVSGQPSTAYTISLPADGVVIMQTAGGGANKDIAVNSFLSFPAAGANGMLSAGGTELLLVGATRAALGAAQVTGNYTQTYTVTVIY